MAFIIISSPSGGGKTTICNMLMGEGASPIFGNVKFSVSTTTRQKRKHETDGKEYFFTSKAKFQKMVNNGEFLEYATVCENYYGTRLASISKTNHTLFDIDFQGFLQIKNNKKTEKLVNIFLLPPSLSQLQERLNVRGDVNQEDIKLRMENAIEEILHCKEYDYILTNYNIKTTFAMVCGVLKNQIFGESLNGSIERLTHTIKNTSLEDVDLFLERSLKETQEIL